MQRSGAGIARIGVGEGQSIRIGGFGTVVKVPASLTAGSASVVEHTLVPGLLGAPPHRHSREDETSYVLEGELTVLIGDEIATVRAGEIVVKPRGQFHAFWNAAARPLRFLEVISPGGFERYFEELALLIPPDRAPELGAIAALGARYGMDFDMARIPELTQRHGLRLG